jgi:hypothetical protein
MPRVALRPRRPHGATTDHTRTAGTRSYPPGQGATRVRIPTGGAGQDARGTAARCPVRPSAYRSGRAASRRHGRPAGRRATGGRGPTASASSAGRRPAGLARDGLKLHAAAIVAELVDALAVGELVALITVRIVGVSPRVAMGRKAGIRSLGDEVPWDLAYQRACTKRRHS